MDTLPVEQTPQTRMLALDPDYEADDANERGESLLSLSGNQLTSSAYRHSPPRLTHVPCNHSHSLPRIFCFCGKLYVTVVFPRLTYLNPQETALINSGTKARRDGAHKEGCSHRSKARSNIRPKDVRFAWLKDVYYCGGNHLDGCQCEGALGALLPSRKSRCCSPTHSTAEHAFADKHPHPNVLSKIFHDCDATPESDQDTHPGGSGSGVRKQASTVSPGLSARSEMSPTSIFAPAEPRPSARSDSPLAGGKELAGLDSTVALMPPFGVVSPEPMLRHRSSGISTPAEFPDGTLGEESMSFEEDDAGTGFTDELTGMARFANYNHSPPSPVVPVRANFLMDALEPILANHTSPSSPEEVTFAPPSLASGHLEYSPLQYSPASTRAYSPVKHIDSPEHDDWVGEPTQAIDGDSFEPILEVEPYLRVRGLQEMATPSTPPPRRWHTQVSHLGDSGNPARVGLEPEV